MRDEYLEKFGARNSPERDFAVEEKAAMSLAGSAKRGSPESDTIGDDLCRRIYNIDNHLLLLDERMSSMAAKVMGMLPETDLNEKEVLGTATLCPPLIERLSSGIYALERRAMQLEHTIDRFSGLV
jgi:hypothetical protein